MAIVVPDVEVVKGWAAQNHIPGTLSVLCSNPDVKQLIFNDMIAQGKVVGLKSFEQVKQTKGFLCSWCNICFGKREMPCVFMKWAWLVKIEGNAWYFNLISPQQPNF